MCEKLKRGLHLKADMNNYVFFLFFIFYQRIVGSGRQEDNVGATEWRKSPFDVGTEEMKPN